MWIRRSVLLLFFLLLLSVCLFGFSELQDQIIESLENDLIIVSSELQLLRGQRQSYKQEIRNLSGNLRKRELSVEDFKKQVIIMNGFISNLNVIIENKEKSLKKSQAEILRLIEQSIGLNSDLLEAKKISIGLEEVSITRKVQIKIMKYIIIGLAVVVATETTYIVIDYWFGGK